MDEIFEYFDGDPWPYGIEENRPTLEALVQYLQDQHLIDAQPTIEELFAPDGPSIARRNTISDPQESPG